MKSIFDGFVDDNIEKINFFLKKDADKIESISSRLHKMIEIQINEVKSIHLDAQQLFVHLLVTRSVAQISFNFYSNGYYYRNCTFEFQYLLTGIDDDQDKQEYCKYFKLLCNQKDLKEDNLLEIFEWGISRYLVISKMLLLSEKRRDTISKVQNTEYNRSDNDKESIHKQVLDSGGWSCQYCDTRMDDGSNTCSVCNADRFEILRATNKEKDKSIPNLIDNKNELFDNDSRPRDLSSKCNDEEQIAHSDGDIRVQLRQSSVNPVKEKCNRCHLRDINLAVSVVCGPCANQMFDKEQNINKDNEPMDTDTKNDRNQSDRLPCLDNNLVDAHKDNVCDETLSNDNWKCNLCIKMNKNDEGACTNCGCWRCQCSAINGERDKVCSVCERVNPFMELCPRCRGSSKDNELCVECNGGLINEQWKMVNGRVTTSLTINLEDKREILNDNIIELSKWSCAKCWLLNTLDLDKCGTCGTDGPHINQWKCDKCFENNSYDNDKCKGCGHCGPHFDKWRCPKCTTINNKLDKQCGTCYNVNTFIRLCNQCYKNDVNTKHSKLCGDCTSGGDRTRNIGQITDRDIRPNVDTNDIIPRVDEWSCAKCSLKNLFDLVVCAVCGNVGPHVDKWKCDKCTCLNDKYRILCSACNELQLDRKIFTISPLQSIKSVFNKDAITNTETRQNYDNKHGSVDCRASLTSLDYKLCSNCKEKNSFCYNDDRTNVNNKDAMFCTKCGIQQYSSTRDCNIVEYYLGGQSKRVWQCPWKRCMHLNDEGSYKCSKCTCPKKGTTSYQCRYCGWTKYNYNPCLQCKDNYV